MKYNSLAKAQEYNLQKNRKEAYWADRYHATAIADPGMTEW